MIAYAPGRRRNARSLIFKWGLVLFVLPAAVAGTAVAAIVAYNARPEPRVIIVQPAVMPTATPVVYVPVPSDPSLPAMYSKPLEVSLGPRVAAATSLRLGPGDAYLIVGALQAGAPLEVVGRDEAGAWLAVVFPPDSALLAWLPVMHALGVTDIEDLPVEPLQFLP